MKHLVSICLILLVAFLVTAPLFDASGQVVNLKRYAVTAGLHPGWPTYTGLRVVGTHTVVYLRADTTGSYANVVTSVSWTILSQPSGSTATLDSSSTFATTITPDMVGQYVFKVTTNGAVPATDMDTIYASTYVGIAAIADPTSASAITPQCDYCHGPGSFTDKTTPWRGTGHAKIFKEGVSGQLEVDASGKGTYSKSCPRCHTTGYNVTANNGNFGYLAHQNGWDTTWYKPYPGYLIPNGDPTIWNQMLASYPEQVPVAAIGCESCHGPGADHHSQRAGIDKTFDSEMCNTCHDAPTHHMVGSWWRSSDHKAMAKGHVASTGCYPCHSGTAFAKWVDNKSNPGWDIKIDGMNPIGCVSCHDPHDASNPHQLRTVTFDGLNNGYVPSPGDGGIGQLCMNCHRSRYNVAARVTSKAPTFGFVAHYGPHGNPQADMFFGSNGSIDTSISGQHTHAGVPGGCVTCHMESDNTAGTSPNGHTWMMVDANGNDRVAACQNCHGANIATFDDILASYDYDGNGKIEGVQTEVQGLLTRLKNKLAPYWNEATPDTLLSPVTQNVVQGIYTYLFVKNDGSMGVHNTKYAVALLQKSLNLYPTDVKSVGKNIPKEFALNQNYPNPFNPSTTIGFALPQKQSVKLEVYDILGKLVTTLMNQEMGAGTYNVVWNGTDQNGAKVSSGMYFYRLQAGSFTSIKKMLMVK